MGHDRILVPFSAEHVLQYDPQPEHRAEFLGMLRSGVDWAEVQIEGMSFSGFRGYQLLGCAGAAPQWTGRAVVWALLSEHIGRHDMLWIHRETMNFLDRIQKDHRRIETIVAMDFAPGHRWANMLKFQMEAVMKQYNNGRDYALYSRII